MMTFEETIAMVFKPGTWEIFVLGFSTSCVLIVALSISAVIGEFGASLIRRYIWPGKQKVVTQSQDPGPGAAD